MAGGLVLGIRLRFHNHAPKQLATFLAFYQPASNQLRGNDLRWTAEETSGKSRKILGDGSGGYGSGWSDNLSSFKPDRLLAKATINLSNPFFQTTEEQLKAFIKKVKSDTSLQEKLKAAAAVNTVVSIAKDAEF